MEIKLLNGDICVLKILGGGGITLRILRGGITPKILGGGGNYTPRILGVASNPNNLPYLRHC